MKIARLHNDGKLVIKGEVIEKDVVENLHNPENVIDDNRRISGTSNGLAVYLGDVYWRTDYVLIEPNKTYVVTVEGHVDEGMFWHILDEDYNFLLGSGGGTTYVGEGFLLNTPPTAKYIRYSFKYGLEDKISILPVYNSNTRITEDGNLFTKEIIEKESIIKTPYLDFKSAGTVSVPHNNIFNLTDAITISVRIKITDTSENVYGQFMTKKDAFAWFLGVRRSDGYTVWYSKMNGGVNNNWGIGRFPELVDGTWHHIVFTYDKDAGENNQKFYIDGILKAQKTTTGTLDTSTNPINLVTSSFFGGIRDARIYNRQLTDSEVMDLSNGIDIVNGKVGHWKIDEGEGSVVYDSSGNGNNGIITGGATWEEDVEQVSKLVQFQPNGDLILYGELIEDYNF